MPTFDRFYSRGNFRLYYRHTFVNPKAPTYVLLHGWSGNNTCFVPLERLLQANGFNTVTPDYRGHGLSSKTIDRKSYKLDEFVEDLDALLLNLKAQNVTLLGYSAGGTIALRHEIKYPGLVEKIILVGANHRNPLRSWGLGWSSPLLKYTLLAGAKVCRFERKKEYKDIDLVRIDGTSGSMYKDLKRMRVDVNFWLFTNYSGLNIGNLSHIEVPVYVVRGAEDRIYTKRESQKLVKKIPHARTIHVPDAGHTMVTENEELLLDTVEDLLAESS